jgi:hypothetical protein
VLQSAGNLATTVRCSIVSPPTSRPAMGASLATVIRSRPPDVGVGHRGTDAGIVRRSAAEPHYHRRPDREAPPDILLVYPRATTSAPLTTARSADRESKYGSTCWIAVMAHGDLVTSTKTRSGRYADGARQPLRRPSTTPGFRTGTSRRRAPPRPTHRSWASY